MDVAVADERLAVLGGPSLGGSIEVDGVREHRVAFDGIEQIRVARQIATQARQRGEEGVRRDDEPSRAPA